MRPIPKWPVTLERHTVFASDTSYSEFVVHGGFGYECDWNPGLTESSANLSPTSASLTFLNAVILRLSQAAAAPDES